VLPTRANGQLAFGHYFWDADARAFVGESVGVITLRGAQIEDLTAFRTPALLERFGLPSTVAA
jgi:RNA polymerase sigma-70 factor (ECF subfamily)